MGVFQQLHILNKPTQTTTGDGELTVSWIRIKVQNKGWDPIGDPHPKGTIPHPRNGVCYSPPFHILCKAQPPASRSRAESRMAWIQLCLPVPAPERHWK